MMKYVVLAAIAVASISPAWACKSGYTCNTYGSSQICTCNGQ